MKIAVLDAGTLGVEDSEWDALRGLGEVELHEATDGGVEAVIERIGDAEAVLTNKVPLEAGTLRQAKALRYIGVLATGYNVVDVKAAAECGVVVCNVPSYATAATAQHAVALMLELCNRTGEHDASVHQGEWVDSRHFCYWKSELVELDGRTVGIVGFGSIGRRVGEIVHALGAGVLASARTRRDAPSYSSFEWADNEEIFARADIVTLHCPETSENAGFVDAGMLCTMKPGAMLVNTARGGLVDEKALAEGLRVGRPAAAALDVLRNEPMTPDCPLLGAPNCIITPHIAWAAASARSRLLKVAVDNLAAFLQGSAQNVVG